MPNAARITIDLPFDWDGPLTDEVREALDSLANIMLVQAEDGLYTGGNPDGDDAEFLFDFRDMGVTVDYVEVDTWSSASRQHYIDTGRYLNANPTPEDHAESWCIKDHDGDWWASLDGAHFRPVVIRDLPIRWSVQPTRGTVLWLHEILLHSETQEA